MCASCFTMRRDDCKRRDDSDENVASMSSNGFFYIYDTALKTYWNNSPSPMPAFKFFLESDPVCAEVLDYELLPIYYSAEIAVKVCEGFIS